MRWSYNEQWETCTPFIYGGCGGTDNLFLSKEDCIEGTLVQFSFSLNVDLLTYSKGRFAWISYFP